MNHRLKIYKMHWKVDSCFSLAVWSQLTSWMTSRAETESACPGVWWWLLPSTPTWEVVLHLIMRRSSQVVGWNKEGDMLAGWKNGLPMMLRSKNLSPWGALGFSNSGYNGLRHITVTRCPWFRGFEIVSFLAVPWFPSTNFVFPALLSSGGKYFVFNFLS